MTRTTRTDLERLARFVSDRLAEPYTIGYAYGRPRLERASGSVDVSPRLPAGELAEWMRAYLAGIDAAERRRALPLPPPGCTGTASVDGGVIHAEPCPMHRSAVAS